MSAEQSVLNTLVDRIEAREWEVGQRLPPERSLAEMLGASRSTVRTALRLLKAQGVVDIRGGSGCYLRCSQRSTSGAASREPATAGDGATLLEACVLFFPSVAALCARQATAECLADMDECAIGLSRAIFSQNIAALTDELGRFMQALALGTDNPAIVAMVEDLCARTLPLVRMIVASLNDAERDAIFADHVRIIQALKAHDPGEARRRMEEGSLRLALLLARCLGAAATPFVMEEARARGVEA